MVHPDILQCFQTQRVCIQMFAVLVEAWGSGEFGSYVCTTLMPTTFTALAACDPRDAQTVLVCCRTLWDVW